ncbi:hypothetical protein Nepgr_032361 [Nepenthes gracilis]|uniref:Uncharacterized protein n=1 Tax=Nepenthes gracilis TaxID=150966 RepID=A0AAD3TKA2_NEPGR|nr:hypothetical protein Nepgr_032361 [Nepenthes gracilis]
MDSDGTIRSLHMNRSCLFFRMLMNGLMLLEETGQRNLKNFKLRGRVVEIPVEPSAVNGGYVGTDDSFSGIGSSLA